MFCKYLHDAIIKNNKILYLAKKTSVMKKLGNGYYKHSKLLQNSLNLLKTQNDDQTSGIERKWWIPMTAMTQQIPFITLVEPPSKNTEDGERNRSISSKNSTKTFYCAKSIVEVSTHIINTTSIIINWVDM